MSPCPVHPQSKGRHVGLLLPLEDAMGEWFVVHQCDVGGSHHWQEPVRDCAALFQRAMDIQGRPGGILWAKNRKQERTLPGCPEVKNALVATLMGEGASVCGSCGRTAEAHPAVLA